MKSLFVMLPCYNEEKDITPLLQKWLEISKSILEYGYQLKIYCIDDKSTDSTNAIIKSFTGKNPDSVNIIEHEINKGLGGALFTALVAFNNNAKTGDICVIMDGDNTHDPKYVFDMINGINNGYDCVIASRYCKTSHTKGVPPLRIFLSDGARYFYSFVLGIKGVKDYTCGYRAYTFSIINSAVEKYGKNLVERRSFACMMELLYKLSLIDAKFLEIPFELNYSNKQGQSKLQLLKTIKESILTAIKLRLSN